MDNIFYDKMLKLSDLELIDIIINRDRYQLEALKAAWHVLKERGIVERGEKPSSYLSKFEKIKAAHEAQLSQLKEENVFLEETSVDKNAELLIKDIKKTKEPFKVKLLPLQLLIDYTGFFSFCLIVSLIFWFPYFDSRLYGWFALFIVPCLAIWQANIVADNSQRRLYHFQIRLLFALFFSIGFSFKSFFHQGHFQISQSFVIFLLILALSGMLSIPIYHLNGAINSSKYFILKRFKWFIPITILVVTIFVGRQESWFKENNRLHWEHRRQLTIDDFRGYADYFTHYDAAISSTIDYETDDEGSITAVYAVCNTGYTWVNPWDKDGYFLLQHEQYHFNVTEVVARMARKELYWAIQSGATNDELIQIIVDHRNKKDDLQDQYDTETDHSILSNEQARWQYHIDSLLIELDAYWTSDILRKHSPDDSIKYFRNMKLNVNDEPVLTNQLMPSEERYATFYKVTYDSMNRVVTVKSFYRGTPAYDESIGAYGIRYEYASDGFKLTYLGKKDLPYKSTMGAAIVRSKRVGDHYHSYYFDIDDRPTQDDLGTHKVVSKVDRKSRIIEQCYFDLNGKRNLIKGMVSLKQFEYSDELSLPSTIKYFDNNYRPVENEIGVFSENWTHDAIGNPISFSQQNINGNYVKLSGNAAIKTQKYDELGRLVARSNYDANQNLIEDSEGIARYTWADSRYGSTCRTSYYNRNNVLTLNEDGNATEIREYDPEGNIVTWANYGTGNELLFDDDLYGKVLYERDSLGRLIKLTNLNGYDYPVKSDGSGRIRTFSYDTTGLIHMVKLLDVNGELEAYGLGWVYVIEVYDNASNRVSSQYFDENHNPIAVENDVATFRYQYDARNNKLEARFYDVKDSLAQANQGISINKYIYDDNDNLIERTYWNQQGQLATFDGAARITWSYDDQGNEIEIIRYDSLGRLIKKGIAKHIKKYDINGNCIEEIKLDGDEFGITDEPSITKYIYNSNSKLIEKSFFDSSYRPMVDKKLVHKYSFEYQEELLIKESYFDVNNLPIKVDAGYASWMKQFDDFDNEISLSYLDESGFLVDDSVGVAMISYEHDAYDRVIVQSFFDKKQNPVLSSEGCHVIKYKRANSGDIIEQICLDEAKEIIEDKEGYALIVKAYNRNGVENKKDQYNLIEAKKYLEL